MKQAIIKNGIFQIYELPENHAPFPTIVMLHGFTGNHLEPSFLFARFSKEAKKRGYATVRFDFKGSGNSDGEFYNMTSKTELEDALSILRTVKEDNRFDKDRLFVIGLSMGGTIALRMVGNSPNTIKACVLWSAASYNKEIFSQSFKTMKKDLVETETGYDVYGLEVSKNFMDEILSYNAVDEAKKFNGPYLLVHGSKDPTVPLEISIKASQNLPNAKLHIVENADHTYRSIKWSQELFDVTLAFLDKLI